MKYVAIIILLILAGCAKKPPTPAPVIEQPIQVLPALQEPEPPSQPVHDEPVLVPTFDNILFGFDSYQILIEQTLADLIAYLKQSDSEVILEGHACEIGPEVYNMTLSQSRATQVRIVLVTSGISSDRIESRAYGESRPISEDLMLNRRVEIKIK